MFSGAYQKETHSQVSTSLYSPVYLKASLIVIYSEMSPAFLRSANYIIILVSPLLGSGFLLMA